MAKQTGDIKIRGSFSGLCFYRMEGRCYVRLKSSLTSKRFWKDAAFAGSRRSAALLKEASPLASRLYRLLPKERKGRVVFQKLTGEVRRRLAAGAEAEAIETWFRQTYLPEAPSQEREQTEVRVLKTSAAGFRIKGLFQLPCAPAKRKCRRRRNLLFSIRDPVFQGRPARGSP